MYRLKQFVSDVSLGSSIIILLLFVNNEILVPANTDYEFEIILKSSELYDEPVFLVFHWVTAEELQVGKVSSLWVEIQNLPYTEKNLPLNEIYLQFDERQLNYLHTSKENGEYTYQDKLIFEPNWNLNVFESNKIELRFIVPTDIFVDFCDENIQKCSMITNVIHPAPFDLNTQIQSNRTNSLLSFVIIGLTFVIIWVTLRPK